MIPRLGGGLGAVAKVVSLPLPLLLMVVELARDLTAMEPRLTVQVRPTRLAAMLPGPATHM
jgi:hypothetical protein